MTGSERPTPEVERLMIDAIRVLSMDAVQAANSGHPGTPMALASVGTVLWTRHLKHAPQEPEWLDRDRFVLSAGHASMLLYSLLHLSGYDLTLDDIRAFRQWGSQTPGHPEYRHTPGIETTTGPLGQGIANSVGMALAERWMAAHFNRPDHRIVDHRTWVICSDGDLMEGISHEAAELAGHHRLGKLVWIFDDNRITIEGDTELASSTDQAQRFEAYGWRVLRVEDGNSPTEIDTALSRATAESDRPTLIILRTVIAQGSPNWAGHHSTHGAPLGEAEIQATKENLGYPSLEPFHVDDGARAWWRRSIDQGAQCAADWHDRFEAYQRAHPKLAEEFEQWHAGTLPDGWHDGLAELMTAAKPEATRASSGKALQLLAGRLPNLIGGSADLGPSNKTDIDGADDLLPATPAGRVIHFGIREHAMGSIMNGLALHGGVRAFGGTFLIFSDYMRPAIRLAALMGLPTIYVFTHDSIGLGEDGPTHQPIEQLPSMRALQGLLDLRPADAAETAAAWRLAIERQDGPTFLSLTRQGLPPLPGSGPAEGNPSGESQKATADHGSAAVQAGGESVYDRVRRGGYVVVDAEDGNPTTVLIASGSEVEIALATQALLAEAGVSARVVSLPSWHLFAQQDRDYRDRILPRGPLMVSIEAASTFGWEKWVGTDGIRIGIDHFGASAPANRLFEEFGLTPRAVTDRVTSALSKNRQAT